MKRKIRRFLAVLLSTAMCLSLVACGDEVVITEDNTQNAQVTEVTEVTEKVTDIEAKILELISDNPAITTSKLADMLSVTRKTISTHIKIMKKNNVIERIGSDRKGYWKIL